MNEVNARLLVDQLKPLLKKSKSFMCKIDLDIDNEEIVIMNMFNAILWRLYYPNLRMIDALYDISDYLIGR